MWRCQCDCGNEKIITAARLAKGTQSCGCLQKETAKAQAESLIAKARENLRPVEDVLLTRLYGLTKAQANRRKIEFLLTEDELRQFSFAGCFYCNNPPTNYLYGKGRNKHECLIYSGIDRLDSQLGYNITNCVTACKRCNTMKNGRTLDDFLARIRKIVNRDLIPATQNLVDYTKSDAAINDLIRGYTTGAKNRNLSYSLTKEEFTKLISTSCHYCNDRPSRLRKVNSTSSIYFNGVDRKNSDLGYETDNVVPCCTDCNFLKGTIEYIDFLDHIKKIYTKTKSISIDPEATGFTPIKSTQAHLQN
jgi:5-methylcytosine-specific restriction endonuclease McrA